MSRVGHSTLRTGIVVKYAKEKINHPWVMYIEEKIGEDTVEEKFALRNMAVV